MIHYLIRRDGIEFPIEGVEALERLVLEGSLEPGQKVFDPKLDAWVRAEELAELEEAFEARRKRERDRLGQGERAAGVPRAAPPDEPEREPRSREGEASPEKGRGPSTGKAGEKEQEDASDAPTLDPSHLEPLDGPPPEDELDDDEEPTEEVLPRLRGAGRAGKGHPPPAGPRPPRGQVIPFPGTRRAPDRSPLAPELEPLPSFLEPAREPAATARRERPAIRAWVPITALVLSVSAMLAVRAYYRYYAHLTLGPRRGHPAAVHPVSAAAAPAPPPTAAPTPSLSGAGSKSSQAASSEQGGPTLGVYAELEESLRDRLRPTLLPIEGEDGLETALLVELSRLGVGARRIHAPITRWRPDGSPQAAEIHIWYPGQPGELDRELAAIGLVVGKYIHGYSLEVPAVQVYVQSPDGHTRRHALASQRCAAFFLQDIDMLAFLGAE